MAIKSVSCQYETRDDTIRMVKWMEKLLQNEGATTQIIEVGQQTFPDGKVAPYPPILLAQLGSDPNKKTLCVYGHLDVQPASYEDGWDTEPFVLIEKDEKLYGRGSTDDKGPVLGWLHTIQAYKANNVELPVNFKVSFYLLNILEIYNICFVLYICMNVSSLFLKAWKNAARKDWTKL